MKRILSYLFPIRLKNYTSSINGQLEVNLYDGKKTLDTLTSNYSYGSLQKILHKGLTEIKFNNNTKSVLILGLGAGCVIQTIREEFHSEVFIEAVDIDSEIISIAIKDFDLNRFKNIKIICADAADYIENSNDTFDLIIVDIFIGDVIPEIFTKSKFINLIVNHIGPKGKVIYNVYRKTMTIDLLTQIKNEFSKEGMNVKVIEKVERTNDLIIAEKLLQNEKSVPPETVW